MVRSEGSPLPRPPWYQAPPRTPNANGVVSPGTRNRQPIGIARHQPKSPQRGGFCEAKGRRSRGHPGTSRRHARPTPKALFLRKPGIDVPSGSPDINPNHPNGVVSARRRVAAPAATLVPGAATHAQRPRRCFSGNSESTTRMDRTPSTGWAPHVSGETTALRYGAAGAPRLPGKPWFHERIPSLRRNGPLGARPNRQYAYPSHYFQRRCIPTTQFTVVKAWNWFGTDLVRRSVGWRRAATIFEEGPGTGGSISFARAPSTRRRLATT